MNGIIQTALRGLPLELEYRPHADHYQDITVSGSSVNLDSTNQQPEQKLSEEFACLLSAL